jgi:hypothetical protein
MTGDQKQAHRNSMLEHVSPSPVLPISQPFPAAILGAHPRSFCNAVVRMVGFMGSLS